jgi:hypothetical protein
MSEPGNGLAEWSEADEEIRRKKADIEGLKEFIEGKDPDVAAKARQRRDELFAEVNQKDTKLTRERSEILRRELEREVLEDQYRYWRKLVLDCRAADTPDFEHFTRMFVEALENEFAGRVLLWFAGFPITGRLAGTGKDRNRDLLLTTTLYFRARDEAAFKEVENFINAKDDARHPSWFDDWRKVASRDCSDNISFEPGAWKNQDAPKFESWEPVAAEGDLEPQADDLYIAAEDGRMYLMRSADYRPRPEKVALSWQELQAKETTATRRTAELVSNSLGNMSRVVETQLAHRMIDAGVSLAAIPSTGLPTRGSYCFLVNLAPYPAPSASRK